MRASQSGSEALRGLKPAHDSLVCLDSDGCVFDTMEVKQRACFHPLIVSHWQLEAVAPLVHETARFVNLYSRWRGGNRFPNLLRTFDLLRARPEVVAAGVAVPALDGLRGLIASGVPLGNPALADEVSRTHDAGLRQVLEWSLAVNRRVAEVAASAPAFAGAVAAIERMRMDSDLIVVSQTPTEALVREWRLNRLEGHVAFIAGQEVGSKTEHISLASAGRYAPGRVLMVGDALGDLEAARQNRSRFFPILPGGEEESWRRLLAEVYGPFLDGAYTQDDEQARVAEFLARLPERPPWESNG